MSQEFTMSVNSSRPRAAAPPVVAALLPIIAVVFIAFLVIGLALPVLPLHVHQDLGLGTFVVGLVAGAQFAASLLSRFWAGNYADSRGAKRALVTGLLVAAVAGLLYLLSLRFVSEPETSVTILLLGRAVLGVAESFIVTGAFTWGLSLVGPQNTGKIMAWVGTAMYAAFAVGAPAGNTPSMSDLTNSWSTICLAAGCQSGARNYIRKAHTLFSIFNVVPHDAVIVGIWRAELHSQGAYVVFNF